MGGHVVLAVQNSSLQEQLVTDLAAVGYCALCFPSAEEAVAYLREGGCPASVGVFHAAMRRQSDLAALAELCVDRPELQLLFPEEEGVRLEALRENGRRLVLLPHPLNSKESFREILEALRRSPAVLEPSVTRNGSPVRFSVYSDEFLRRVGAAEVPVLLSGETGVGKEVMARQLCAYSARAGKPFLKINCAALPPELAESELFGSAKGAFTGAANDRQGRFESADGGTILLDEIGDMDLRLQTKLLHVLQDGEVQPLGSNRTVKVNVRVMAATHRDLTRGIADGTFREDLYYRLNVIKIVIPPLRERREEILPLAQKLLERHLRKGHAMPRFNGELRAFLQNYAWPGNVRELENVMRRLLVYEDADLLLRELKTARDGNGASGQVGAVDRATEVRGPASSKVPARAVAGGVATDRLDRLAEASRQAEMGVLLEALEAHRWNRRKAAASLHLEYKAFLYKLQKYGIVVSKGKGRAVSASQP